MTLLNHIRTLAADNDVNPVLTDAKLQETVELLSVRGEGDNRRINLLHAAIEYLYQIEAFRPDTNPQRVKAASERRAFLEKIHNDDNRRERYDVEYDLEAVVVISGGSTSGGTSGTVNQATVYELLKDILVEGAGITLTNDDVEDEITLSSKDQTARDAAAAAQGAADSAATAAGNANSAAAKVAQDLVAETTARTSADSALDARVKTLEDGGTSVGIESILLPAKSSGGADRRATVTMTWTLAEIRTVEAQFAEPEGDFILSAMLSDQSEFTVEHVEWDDTNSELDVVLRNVGGGTRADTYTGRVTLNVLRGAEGGGGGTGDVTTAQLEAEAKARSDGDDLQVETVGTVQRYADVIALQANSAQPLRMIISADIQVPVRQGVTQALSEGEILEFAPRSTTPEPYLTVNLNWRDDLTHVSDTASTETEWNAKTAAHATVHNNLWLRVTKRLFSTISGARRAREVGELYHVPPRSTIANFIVDTTSKEEADAIVNNAIANGVALWARGPGQNVDNQNNRAYPLPGDLAPNPQKDYALFNNGNRNEWRAVSASGTPLSDDDKAVLVGLVLEPASVIGRLKDSFAGTYTLRSSNAAALPTSLFWSVLVQGQVIHPRTAWTHGNTRTFTIDDTEAERIANNLPAGDNHLNVDVQFHDASSDGNLVAQVNLGLGVLPEASTGGGGGGPSVEVAYDSKTAVQGNDGTFTLENLSENEVVKFILKVTISASVAGSDYLIGVGSNTAWSAAYGEFIGATALPKVTSETSGDLPRVSSQIAEYLHHSSSITTATFYAFITGGTVPQPNWPSSQYQILAIRFKPSGG